MRGLGMAAAAVAGAVAGAAHAEPGLANKVYDPYVRNGVTEVELRAGRLNGGPLDGESAGVVELEHGFSDRVSLAVLAEFEHHAGEESKLDAIAVEGVTYLGQIPGTGVDVGAYLEYEQRIHAESGVAEAKLLLARQFGPVRGLLNLIVEKPLTNKDEENETEFGYALQATAPAAHGLNLGLQAFGDLGTDHRFGGRQAHYLGPVAHWEVRPRAARGEIELEAAYLLPVGVARHEADGQLRLMLEYETRF